MKDKSYAKYWFRSHHLSEDMGGTLFKFSDGSISYMAGWFCCDVQLPKEQFSNLNKLKEYINEYYGIAP